MLTVLRTALSTRSRTSLWRDTAPIREELFGPERLEQHAKSLARAQPVTLRPPAVWPLRARLKDNAKVLLAAYRASAASLAAGNKVVPAAEWLLDNYHLVELQIREIHQDLPPGYYRQLPKLSEGPFAGYPRVFGIAWGFVAHTDSHFDARMLQRFIAAYQSVQPLTIGELWAVAITLRIVLIENLRRLADQITAGREQRADADGLADRLLTPERDGTALNDDISTRTDEPLNELFAAQLAKRLRGLDPDTTPAVGWLDEHLRQQGTTLDQAVQHAQLRQGASNLTVRNVITSMRLISAIDWADLFESVSLVDERLREGSNFGSMDFATRNLYRSAIEELARSSPLSELEVAAAALQASSGEGSRPNAAGQLTLDPGYHLLMDGRPALEQRIGFVPPRRLRFSRFNKRMGMTGYLTEILLVTLGVLALALWAIASAGSPLSLISAFAFLLLAAIPASELATALVNRVVTRGFGALTLPGMELKTGVPEELRTLVVVPTLLSSKPDLLEQVERLEVHHLSGDGGDLTFALLTDGVDATTETLPSDAVLLAAASNTIKQLNLRYGPGPAGPRFLLLHRHRRFNARENIWMGWERKRGKLTELNRLLRGATDTSFMALDGIAHAPGVTVPQQVKYVITLDADTRMPRDTALRLVGKMAHPLNRPRFDEALQRNVGGYAILQPRVTPALPFGRDGSLYQRIYSGPAGMDPYAAAVSDVYQDLFGEGSFTGKGIYDVDAFEAAMVGRVPENCLLSHDLFEGIFARSGLASDIEVVEDFPSRYDVAGERQHRWTRGDWQLLPWLLGLRIGECGTAKPCARQAVPPVGRGKMADNLRRSLLPIFTLASLALCWLLPLPAAIAGTLVLIAICVVPAWLPIVCGLMPAGRNLRLSSHLANLRDDFATASLRALCTFIFLPDQAWRMGDAIVRTSIRMFMTREHLLEWTTSAGSTGKPRLTLAGFYRRMAGGVLLGAMVVTTVVMLAPNAWPLVIPFAILWLLAPAMALYVSRPVAIATAAVLNDDEAAQLRLIARQTWRFFETFVTPEDNYLPPDNFQEDPRPVIARRTSPTNMGLYLLSCVAARDFGWASTHQAVERLQQTLNTMARLPRHKGHFYNWYGTEDLRILEPAYVSSVDSGNLAGHLLVVATACEEWMTALIAPLARQGVEDSVLLAQRSAAALPVACANKGPLIDKLQEIATALSHSAGLSDKAALNRLTSDAVAMTETGEEGLEDELVYWVVSLQVAMQAHWHDLERSSTNTELQSSLAEIATTARSMALAMNFAFLLEPERKLLSIGYLAADNSLDASCYDLLASEARLASLFAIAKGDINSRHWFRLGRSATPVGGGSALISWSGSMFEYLMPSLVMRAPTGSLLAQTNSLVVARQQDYGRALGIPWGVSESAFNARDMEFTYQYSNFGVPGLGLKRGLSENVVIAPYATGLATMVDPVGALQNYQHLQSLGARGHYGFYEAVDFTRSRLPDGQKFAIVRNYMAHHQGMTIVAIANALNQGQMRLRFHRDPMVQGCELLLQERLPRVVAIAHPRAEEVSSAPIDESAELNNTRSIDSGSAGALSRPITHLLSNGRYAVMLTASGAGYSRWRDIAITRWREDVTRDSWGAFVFMRDSLSGAVWGTSAQSSTAAGFDAIFGEDHAEFIRHDGDLTTAVEVLVSGEDDGEVRRVSLINGGRNTRTIELTTYAEVVLAASSTDNAHPAFAKMFVQTEYLADCNAIIATRRPRAQGEPVLWAAHFAVLEKPTKPAVQYETNRAQFFSGSNGDIAAVIAAGKPLSNSVGTVLDPIFSLRHSLKVPPGKVTRIAFWTVVAESRGALLDLIDTHLDSSAFERARTLAWTQAQVQLRHLGVNAETAADFQRLAAPILYTDPRFRSNSATISRGAGEQSGLWSQSISGDLPIVLLRIDDVEDMAQVSQLLSAHEYWRMKRLAVDLVIINERAASYVQDLQIAIETAVRSSQSRHRFGAELAQGSVFTLRTDLIPPATRDLLYSVARVVLVAHRGPLAQQITRLLTPSQNLPPAGRGQQPLREPVVPPPAAPPVALLERLEFFNGLGGFDKDGTEYVTVLTAGQRTPAPWINVVSNPGFGFQVSTEGSGYTWADNSRENQLTGWSNDPVLDPVSEAIYIRDEVSGELWSPTAQPINDGGVYIARHGFGYSRFEHRAHDIEAELLQFVPLADPVKISRLKLTNHSNRSRRLSVTAYLEWVLGSQRGLTAPFVITHFDEASAALMAHNPWSAAFCGRTAFADIGGRQSGWTADRSEFLGRRGHSRAPVALLAGTPLSGAAGAGLDPCAALQRQIELQPGETVEVLALVGQERSVDAARALIHRYRAANLDAVLAEVALHWNTLLRSVQVKTPDRAMDIMLNGWLLYQTLACRVWARSAFYQASGAYGFRDQLQDGMALTFARPGDTRAHLLRAASRQFVEGDVQHWWLPHSGQGVRTRISDDRVWLSFATATYIKAAGDEAILDEPVAFLQGQVLEPGQHDAFFQPIVADEVAPMFEHCARGLDQCLSLTGTLGLPLIGTGDWNDGMNRVGEAGQGESVWLGWLLVRTLELFIPYARLRDPARASRWAAHRQATIAALEASAWDGQWYRRATFDDGTWLGSKDSDECRIDSIAQSWAVLSGAGDPLRAKQAMDSVDRLLIRPDEGLALLFTPPFDKTHHDPGYIKGYPPGLRENGGQYSHAAMWAILAHVRLGQGDRAHALFQLLNPINHGNTAVAAQGYKVEPYVVAADVYSVAPNQGRGGWTWYTGAAGWMYRGGMEGILGVKRVGDHLELTPCLPAEWPGFEAEINLADTRYTIRVQRDDPGPDARPAKARLDGAELAIQDGLVRLALDGGAHDVSLILGTGLEAVTPV